MQGHITNYTKKRYFVYLIASIIIFALPFIRINENHFFLLSFDHSKLNLFFISFLTQEFYLMPFVLIFLFLFIFFITTLGGRIWCAWSCHKRFLELYIVINLSYAIIDLSDTCSLFFNTFCHIIDRLNK